jgi:hypothetical protein
MTLRMDFEDHLDSMEERISNALDGKRSAVAQLLNCSPALVDSLTIEEISDVVSGPVTTSFFEKYPHHVKPDSIERCLIHGLLDHWKAGIYLSQFPETVKALVQSFLFKAERLLQATHGRDPDLIALRKLLKGADLFDDHRNVLRDMCHPAIAAASSASEAGDDLRCRELLQMVQASVFVVQFGKQTTTIRTIANDNVPEPEALAPRL